MKPLKTIITAFLLVGMLGVGSAAWSADKKMTDAQETDGAGKATLAKVALKEDAVCTRCHDENDGAPILTIYQTKHGVRGDARAPTCQSCHGASESHMKGDPNVKGRALPDRAFKKGVPDDQRGESQCLTCHRGAKLNNWDGNLHQNNGVSCNDCHSVHRPADKVLSKGTQTEVCVNCHKERRADIQKISSHPIKAGKVVCSDCHNPHGSSGPNLLKKNTVLETCFQCHAEKRGPFLFEHQPMTESCANCHNPHGSNIGPLLKSRPPFLCQECHDGSHVSATPVGPNAAGFQGGLSTKNPTGVAQTPSVLNVGRACMNCHSQIHGTNSPAGGFFQR